MNTEFNVETMPVNWDMSATLDLFPFLSLKSSVVSNVCENWSVNGCKKVRTPSQWLYQSEVSYQLDNIT